MVKKACEFSLVRAGAGLACLVGLAGPAVTAAQSAASGETQAGRIEEIIITAERLEQSVQDSSLPIQVLTSEDLDRSNLTQATDLNTVVPGLQIGTGGNAPQIYIRGVGDFAASALSNPAIAVHIDGVYVARPQAVNSLFYDLARIEVLKGPQGTLYGRNSSGGAINLISNRPSLDAVDGYATVTLGDYEHRQLEAAVNVPLGQTVAVRTAVNLLDRDGYLSDGTDDDERQAARVRLLWEPGEASLLVNVDYASESGAGPGYVMLPTPAGTDEWTSASSPEANAVLVSTPPLGFLVPPVQADSFRDNTFWNVSAELNLDLGFADLTVLPAYRDVRLRERNYPAGLRNFIPEAVAEQLSLETRLANDGDRTDWVVGVYYFDEDQRAEQRIFQGILQDNIGFYNPDTRSYAAFGQATVSVSESVRLIAGLRYTYEERSVSGQIFTNSPLGLPPGTPLPALLESFGGSDSFDSTTWRAGIEYDLTPDSMVFLTASTGFKAGGFNQTVPPEDTYESETITAFELGSRNLVLDGRLQVNLEAFYWELDDAQIAHVKFDPLGNVNLITDNAGSSTIRGANIDVVAVPADNIELRGFVEYNDAEYDRFQYDTAFSIFGNPLFNPLSVGCPVGNPFAGPVFGTELITVDCSGFQMPRTPEWSGAASYSHSFDLARGATITATVAAQFSSDRWLGFEFVPPQYVSSDSSFDFDISYVAPDDRWSISAFVRNIADEARYTGGGVQAFAPPLVYATIAPPRTSGVRFSYDFGR